MNDPRSLYISEDIEQMMPVNTFEDFNQFKCELPDLEDIGKSLKWFNKKIKPIRFFTEKFNFTFTVKTTIFAKNIHYRFD